MSLTKNQRIAKRESKSLSNATFPLHLVVLRQSESVFHKRFRTTTACWGPTSFESTLDWFMALIMVSSGASRILNNWTLIISITYTPVSTIAHILLFRYLSEHSLYNKRKWEDAQRRSESPESTEPDMVRHCVNYWERLKSLSTLRISASFAERWVSSEPTLESGVVVRAAR